MHLYQQTQSRHRLNTSPAMAKKILEDRVIDSSTSNDCKKPPEYYDSEPSNQPPRYSHASSGKVPRPFRPANSASAAHVSAILAYPSASQLEEEKRSWRERWREWKARNNDSEFSRVQVSGPTLNVQGVGVKSWTSITPAKKGRGK